VGGRIACAILLFGVAGSVFLKATRNDHMPGTDDRISTVFDQEFDREPAALLRAAAWAKFEAKTFSAAACLFDTPPRLACGDLADSSRLSVSTVSLPSVEADSVSLAEAVEELAGVWQGDGLVLRIDRQRSQANTNPAAPFEWKRFVIRRAKDGTITFALGSEIFKAIPSSSVFALTSTSFRGEKILVRN
jgi:hypothetical protein